jgi:hypothetical protein
MPALQGRAGLLWLVPIIFAVHNLEEGLTIGRYLPRVRARLPARLRTAFAGLDSRRYAFLLVAITLTAFLIAAFGDLAAPGAAGYALLALQATMLVNVVSHVAAALLLRGYGPGLVTALALNLPFSLILLNTAWNAAWYPHAALLWLLPLALLLHGPVLVGLLAATSRIRFG